MYLVQSTYSAPNHQSTAVLAYVRHIIGDGIESSWDDGRKDYRAEPLVNEWYNGREREYVIHMRDASMGLGNNQINIAFYEHRSSDSIAVLVFEAFTFNPPILLDVPKDHPFQESSSAGSKFFSYGHAEEAAQFIVDTLTEFWDKHNS